MIGIPVGRTALDRKIERLEDRLDYLLVEYYENDNRAVSVDTMRTLELVIDVLRGRKCSNEII